SPDRLPRTPRRAPRTGSVRQDSSRTPSRAPCRPTCRPTRLLPEALLKADTPLRKKLTSSEARLSFRLTAPVMLWVDRHAVSVDQLAAEVARDRDQDDAEHREQERDGVAPAHHARTIRRSQVEA